MRPALLKSLTIRDTQIDNLDLTNATIKGDVLMERVRGGSVKAWLNASANIVLRNSQFTPKPGIPYEFQLAAVNAINVLIDTVDIRGDGTILIGFGAIGKDPANIPPPQNKSFVVRSSVFSNLDSSFLNSESVRFEGKQIDRLNMADSRIGRLEMSNTKIAYALDLTNTQAKQQNIGLYAGGMLGRIDKLEGSNIKLEKR